MVTPSLQSPAGRPVKALFAEYGIAFGGAVISMSELINSFTRQGLVQATVLSALPKEIIAPLLNDAEPMTFARPVNYVLRDRVRLALDRSRLPGFLKNLGMKGYAVVDELAGLWYSMRLFRLIKKYDIDVVHVNNGFERDAMRAAKWANRYCIIHCRGLVDDTYRKILHSKLFRVHGDKVIAISSAVVDSLLEQGVAPEKIQLIHNPIEWEKYDAASAAREAVRAKWNLKPSDVVVSIFGRVTGWKGQLEFLQAVKLIIANCPNMKVMIVGDSSDDVHGYSRKVEALANEPPLKGHVIFTGYQKEVPDYYWTADIVVHNSLIPEPFGRVVTEAMACGRAMIAMDEGGPIDIIVNDHDGILVPPRDPDSLAAAIERLYRSPAEREQLGRNARASVREKFIADVIARKVLEVYAQVLKRPDLAR